MKRRNKCSERPAASTSPLLDVHQAAHMLGVKPSTLYQWAYQRRLPVVKLFGPRGPLRFRIEDIQAVIDRSLRGASWDKASSDD